METGTQKRLVDVALVVLTAGALAAGAGYWVSADPGPRPTLDPVVYAEEPPPQEEEPIVSARDAVAAGLSVIHGNLLHEQMLLDGGQEASWTVPMKAGAEYVIDVMCVGSGDLLLEAPGGLTTGVTCDGLISTTIVTAAGPSGLTLRRIQGDQVAAGIRVIEG